MKNSIYYCRSICHISASIPINNNVDSVGIDSYIVSSILVEIKYNSKQDVANHHVKRIGFL